MTTAPKYYGLGLRNRPQNPSRVLTPEAQERFKGRFEAIAAAAKESFKGLTTDGNVVPGLFLLQASGVSTAPVVEAALKLLGRLKYRTSYGQNVLKHSLEVAHLSSVMAAELGANVKLAKRGGLLHDIGKAVDHEVEGPHIQIGADLARKYKESNDVVHCIQAHHGDIEAQTVEAVLVQSADAISAARPGARRETLENYIKRLEALEEIANSFAGVEKCYAIQAGREVRILVKPEDVDDAGMHLMAKDIVKKIEKDLDYPGQIKVNVIRETRSVDFAK
jgi:ribonuclease Y